MRGPGWHVSEGPRPELRGRPAGSGARADRPVVEVGRRPGPDGRSEGQRPPALELEPEAVHGAVVMEPHRAPAGALDDEEERALFPEGPAERVAERHHEPGEPREHLMDLGEEDGRPRAERPREAAGVARAVVVTFGRDLERDPRPGQPDRCGRAGGDPAPGGVLGGETDRGPRQPPGPKAPDGAFVGKPGREGRDDPRALEPAGAHVWHGRTGSGAPQPGPGRPEREFRGRDPVRQTILIGP